MNIAFIIGYFPKLSETFILNQITALIDRGHKVTIFAATNPRETKVHRDVTDYHLLENVVYWGVPRNKAVRLLKALGLILSGLCRNPSLIIKSLNVSRFGKLALTLRLLFLAVHFADSDYDIIQCHFGTVGVFGACLKDMGVGGKLVTTFHGADIRRGIENGSELYAGLFKTGDRFIAISEYNYSHLLEFGAPPEKIVRLPMGLDINALPLGRGADDRILPGTDETSQVNDQASTADSPEGEAPVRIVTVARLAPEKGLGYGIRAVADLLARHPKTRIEYTIIGGGDLEDNLKCLVVDLGLEDTIFLGGPMGYDEVVRHLGRSHLFLLPSLAEALPISLLEAQVAGLPVVATTVGSVSQAMVDGRSGFLVPPEDTAALTDRLSYLLTHREQWTEMGEAGRDYVREHFDRAVLTDKLVELYEQLIE